MIVTPHTVRRLRFRGRVANSRLARQQFEAALADDAGALGLGKEAILCVRRLTLGLRRLDKLKDALDAERVAAARPARGLVPANANAVLFADRAELLACLARDWCGGNATAHWWWPVLFPRDDFGAIVRRAWLEDARPLPTALGRLESAGLAPQFLSRLSPVDITALWRNIVHTFQLKALDVTWNVLHPARTDPAPNRRPRNSVPWSPWISNLPASLTMDAIRLLITALLLDRAPARIRSTSFAHDVRQGAGPRKTRPPPKLKSTNPGSSREGPVKTKFHYPVPLPIGVRSILDLAPPAAASLSPVDPLAAVGGRDQATPLLPPIENPSANARTREARSRPTPFEKGGPLSFPTGTTDDVSSANPITAPDETLTTARLTGGKSRSSRRKNDQRIAPRVASSEESVALAYLPDRIATEWGGVLYLSGVAISLGLYGDFTCPARPGLALPLWDFLALIGGRFVGERFKEDPLYGLFARLSGRSEKEAPGADFEVPTGEPLEIWVDRTCDEMRARITASLGLDHDCDLRPLVLNHHGKIEADEARVDAHFSLANHPIELRVAGLDRDPGWVPAAGRSIYFHYD